MIRPQEVVLLYNDTRFIVCRNGDCWRYGNRYPKSLGACFTAWKKMSDKEIFDCLHWLALEICEFTHVPVRMIRDRLIDGVEGYRQYQNMIGAKALCIQDKTDLPSWYSGSVH